MVTPKTLSRLRWHAGLEEIADPPFPSIMICTTSRDNRLYAALDDAVSDAIDALASVNREVNGPVPSESAARDSEFPRKLVCAVDEILWCLREYQERVSDPSQAKAAGRAEWLIAMAWSAVLDGDIDDLKQHLADEEATR